MWVCEREWRVMNEWWVMSEREWASEWVLVLWINRVLGLETLHTKNQFKTVINFQWNVIKKVTKRLKRLQKELPCTYQNQALPKIRKTLTKFQWNNIFKMNKRPKKGLCPLIVTHNGRCSGSQPSNRPICLLLARASKKLSWQLQPHSWSCAIYECTCSKIIIFECI